MVVALIVRKGWPELLVVVGELILAEFLCRDGSESEVKSVF